MSGRVSLKLASLTSDSPSLVKTKLHSTFSSNMFSLLKLGLMSFTTPFLSRPSRFTACAYLEIVFLVQSQ